MTEEWGLVSFSVLRYRNVPVCRGGTAVSVNQIAILVILVPAEGSGGTSRLGPFRALQEVIMLVAAPSFT